MSNSSIDREEAFRDGQIFEVYNCHSYTRGRQKMIVNTRSLGLFGMHLCSYCRLIELDREKFYVYHIKKGISDDRKRCSNETSILTTMFKNTLSKIKQENSYEA